MTEVSLNGWLEQVLGVLPDGAPYLILLCLISFSEALPMIGLLVPGSTLVVLAGFLAAHGKGNLPALMLVTAIGAFLGDWLSYWLGERLGGRLLKTRSFQKHHSLVTIAERFFCAHGGKSLFFARFLGPIRGITPFIAGLSKMPNRAFLFYTLVSAVLWGIAYPGLGFVGGASWQKAESVSTRFGLLIILALLLTILHYWVRKYLTKNSKEN